eukprot:NODE_1279_length_464_cov_1.311573_g1269_i0.p1 GENE.NODE_1279_length_464_cov_1.311573_g1269_i0~~NODE_1279_length_464_cov_1.311573_g1269_i0.p1  ORF type:complete len:61 (-),score=5.25 NODE_1279_length_464_cov_1.311573_g1269_i0:161-343(-)
MHMLEAINEGEESQAVTQMHCDPYPLMSNNTMIHAAFEAVTSQITTSLYDHFCMWHPYVY